MKRLVLILLMVALVLPVAAKKPQRGIDQLRYPALGKIPEVAVLKATTAQGIRLRLIPETRLPLVNLEIRIKGGSPWDPQDKVGLSDITAQLLRIGGTEGMSSSEVDRFLESRGIDLSISTSGDSFTVSLSCLKDSLDDALSILARLLMKPGLAQDKLDEIKTQTASAIARRNDEPNGILDREFSKILFASSPYGRVMEFAHLDAITTADVASVHRRFFAPGNLLVGVTGPLTLPELQTKMEKAFAGWQGQAELPALPQVEELTPDFKVALAAKENLNQSYIQIGHLGDVYDIEKAAPIAMFNQIFSQSMDSRLFTRVRTQMGLTYGVGGGIFPDYLRRGVTYFGTFTKSESTKLAIQAIFEEIERIRKEPVSDAELNSARDFFRNSFVFKFSSPARILSQALNREYYNLPEDLQKRILEGVARVTAADVIKVAKDYLHPDKMFIVVVGNPAELKDSLNSLGPIKTIDITIPKPEVKEVIPAATPENLAKGKAIFAAALGKGYAGYLKLKTLVSESEAVLSIQGMSLPMKMRDQVVYPDRFYSEQAVMGQKMESVVVGDQGVNRAMGKGQAMSASEAVKKRWDDFGNLVRGADQLTIQSLGTQAVGGQEYDVLYVIDPTKNWRRLYLHPTTGRVAFEEKVSEMPGMPGILRLAYSDYRLVAGVPIPYKAVLTVKGQKVLEVTMTKIQANVAVDQALFQLETK